MFTAESIDKLLHCVFELLRSNAVLNSNYLAENSVFREMQQAVSFGTGGSYFYSSETNKKKICFRELLGLRCLRPFVR